MAKFTAEQMELARGALEHVLSGAAFQFSATAARTLDGPAVLQEVGHSLVQFATLLDVGRTSLSFSDEANRPRTLAADD